MTSANSVIYINENIHFTGSEGMNCISLGVIEVFEA
jgi:hypothetical protein